MKTLKTGLLLLPLIFVSLSGVAQAQYQQTNRIKADGFDGFVPAPGSSIEPKTKLPTRILHQETGIALVLIPAGEFMMGSPETEPNRGRGERLHKRTIRKAFYMGETEVTVAQFRKFVNATRYQTDAERGTPEQDHTKGAFASTPHGDRSWSLVANWMNPFPNLKDYCNEDELPVSQLSWNDAQAFSKHFGFRLPTEAEWEYAYRAGSTKSFPWGEDESGGYKSGNVVDESYTKRFPISNVWFKFNDGVEMLSPVRRFNPNPWKLYDMTGNLQEWCQDIFGEYPTGDADERAAEGPDGSARVMRGSAWLGSPEQSRSAKRFAFPQPARRDFVGFRVAKSN